MTKEIAKRVKDEIRRVVAWMGTQELIDQQIEAVVKAILSAQDRKQKNIKKIFVAGLGRSGFVSDGFTMRLAHLGFDAHVINEKTVPPFDKGDLFIVISGSGKSLKKTIETALDIGAKIVVITSMPDSMDARLADIKFIISGREKETPGSTMGYEERQMRGLPAFLLGTAFEDFTMIVLDAILSTIAVINKKTEDDLKKKHANVTER